MYNIFTLIFLVARIWQVENIPHPTPHNILMGFILLELDEDLQMFLYRNYIKLSRSCIIIEYVIFITIILKGMQLGFNITDRISSVPEILFLHVPGNIPTILLIKPYQKFILSYIYVIYLGTIDQYSKLNSPPNRGAYISYPDPSMFFGYLRNTTTCLHVGTYGHGLFIFSPCGYKTFILV